MTWHAIWHSIIHETGVDYGGRYGHWVPYSFWSGIAGSFLIGVIVWLNNRISRRLHRHAVTAEKALRIAADTHRHVTGHAHPDAPPTTREQS